MLDFRHRSRRAFRHRSRRALRSWMEILGQPTPRREDLNEDIAGEMKKTSFARFYRILRI